MSIYNIEFPAIKRTPLPPVKGARKRKLVMLKDIYTQELINRKEHNYCSTSYSKTKSNFTNSYYKSSPKSVVLKSSILDKKKTKTELLLTRISNEYKLQRLKMIIPHINNITIESYIQKKITKSYETSKHSKKHLKQNKP